MGKKLDLDGPFTVDHRPLSRGRLYCSLAVEAGDPAEDVIQRHQCKGEPEHDKHHQGQLSEQGTVIDLSHMISLPHVWRSLEAVVGRGG